jgi:hypothetical protein
MRIIRLLFLTVCVIFPGPAAAQEPSFEPVGTIGELMIDIIYPKSDELFYVLREPPTNDYEWNRLRGSALILAESGNLLMMEGRSIDQDEWMNSARLLVNVGNAAFEAAAAHDLDAIVALNAELESSCRACHEQYHPRYRRRAQNPLDE